MNPIVFRVLAAIFVVAAGIMLLPTDHTKAFAGLLIVGNLFSIAAYFVERRAGA